MEKDQKTVIQIYIAYFIVVICNIIPSSIIQSFGLVLFIIILIATYFYRSKSENSSLIYNHMQFIVKSIWISSLFLLTGMIASYVLADHSIIYETVESIKKGIMYSEDQLNNIMIGYMKSNITVFAITLSPSFIYLAYRLLKGVIATKRNSIITNTKNWF